MRRRLEGEGIETELEHASWLDESLGRRDTAAAADAPPGSRSEPLYERTRLAARQRDDHHRH
jgi:hypothetical protein